MEESGDLRAQLAAAKWASAANSNSQRNSTAGSAERRTSRHSSRSLPLSLSLPWQQQQQPQLRGAGSAGSPSASPRISGAARASTVAASAHGTDGADVTFGLTRSSSSRGPVREPSLGRFSSTSQATSASVGSTVAAADAANAADAARAAAAVTAAAVAAAAEVVEGRARKGPRELQQRDLHGTATAAGGGAGGAAQKQGERGCWALSGCCFHRCRGDTGTTSFRPWGSSITGEISIYVLMPLPLLLTTLPQSDSVHVISILSTATCTFEFVMTVQ